MGGDLPSQGQSHAGCASLSSQRRPSILKHRNFSASDTCVFGRVYIYANALDFGRDLFLPNGRILQRPQIVQTILDSKIAGLLNHHGAEYPNAFGLLTREHACPLFTLNKIEMADGQLLPWPEDVTML